MFKICLDSYQKNMLGNWIYEHPSEIISLENNEHQWETQNLIDMEKCIVIILKY